MSDTLILTPDMLIKYIQHLQKEKGVSAFAVSGALDGKSSSPSKKIPFYRISCAIAEIFEKPNLSRIVCGHLFIVPIEHITDCNENVIAAHKKNLDIENQGKL